MAVANLCQEQVTPFSVLDQDAFKHNPELSSVSECVSSPLYSSAGRFKGPLLNYNKTNPLIPVVKAACPLQTEVLI